MSCIPINKRRINSQPLGKDIILLGNNFEALTSDNGPQEAFGLGLTLIGSTIKLAKPSLYNAFPQNILAHEKRPNSSWAYNKKISKFEPKNKKFFLKKELPYPRNRKPKDPTQYYLAPL